MRWLTKVTTSYYRLTTSYNIYLHELCAAQSSERAFGVPGKTVDETMRELESEKPHYLTR